MSFDFFTFGGDSTWGDIFFYQKWRIQRNIDAKRYRLLDPWDISRKEGSFEECRKKFVDYIDAYQLARQNGHMIVMLHGMGESKKIFRPLWREATKRNFMAAALNYPSTSQNLEETVRQFDFFLNQLEDVSEISFVVKGASCLVLRKLFSLPSPWRKKIKVKRVLFVNPINSGSDLVAWLGKFKLFKWILGPMAADISSGNAFLIPKMPSNIEQGTIFCDSVVKKITRAITKPFESVLLDDKNSEESYVVKSIMIDNYGNRVFNNENVLKTAIKFLEKGQFK